MRNILLNLFSPKVLDVLQLYVKYIIKDVLKTENREINVRFVIYPRCNAEFSYDVNKSLLNSILITYSVSVAVGVLTGREMSISGLMCIYTVFVRAHNEFAPY